MRRRWVVSSYEVQRVAHQRAIHITTGTTRPMAESPAVNGMPTQAATASTTQMK